MNLAAQKKHFEHHVATLTNYGKIKVLDFKEPGKREYHIRFTFEEDLYTLHITGDLGDLVASNYNNMTFKGFRKHYLANPGYFEGKVECHDRPFYNYDVDAAKKDLREFLDNAGISEEDFEANYTTKEEFIDNVMDYYQYDGLEARGFELIESLVPYVEWSDVSDFGKESSGIIDLYLLAFNLAYEQLKANGTLDRELEEVAFTYNEKKYLMSPDAAQAAYYHIDHRNMLEDAERHLNDYVFGVYDASSLSIRDANWSIDRFKSRFGFSYEDAKTLCEEFVDRFVCSHDSTVDDYTQWRNAIRDVCLEKRSVGYCPNTSGKKDTFIPDWQKPQNP